MNNDSINLINAKQQFINTKRDLNIILGVQQDVNYNVETEVSFITLMSYDELLTKSKANNVLFSLLTSFAFLCKYINSAIG